MITDQFLEATEPSLLVIEERGRTDIIIGVPHHAPAGTPTLPCPEHENSDENAGFLGRYLAEKLDCCSAIACNYRIDVNKSLQSDYSMQIVRWNPRILVEIHGHSGTKAKSQIEISSGGTENDRFSKVLADQLSSSFAEVQSLQGITICGQYSMLYYKASKAITISDDRWISYHIELAPTLRRQPNGSGKKPPDIGYAFCDLLAQALC